MLAAELHGREVPTATYQNRNAITVLCCSSVAMSRLCTTRHRHRRCLST